MTRLGPALALVAATATAAAAYGPGVHVREADRYAELHPELDTPELRPYLRLGAVFPDVRSAGVSLPVNSHDRDLGLAILEVAEATGEPWAIAFATGYRLHTASDTAAQVFYLPWLTGATDLQVVNLFGLEQPEVVGDNELLCEGFGDVHSGDLVAFMDVAWRFLFDEPEALEAVIALFLDGLELHVGPIDRAAIDAGLHAFWDQLAEQVGAFDKDFIELLLVDVKTWSLDAVLEVLTTGALGSVLGELPAAPGSLEPDPAEIARLMAHPVGQDPAAFFSGYDAHFADMGPTMLDEPGWHAWPWWAGPPIVGGVVSGFALHGEHWDHQPRILLWGWGFTTPDGTPIDSVDATAVPVELVAWAELFLAFGEPTPVVLEVVEEPFGVQLDKQRFVLGQAQATLVPGSERVRLEAPITLDAIGWTEALSLRVRHADDARPFLETDWDRYRVGAAAPLFRPPYRDDYEAWLPRLALDSPYIAPQGWGWIRGHVVLPGEREGLAAAVVRASSGEVTAAGPGGGYALDELDSGSYMLTAAATGWATPAPLPVLVEDGEVVADLHVLPVPVATVPTWITSPEVPVSWSTAHFEGDGPVAVEASVGDDVEPASWGPWTSWPADAGEVVVPMTTSPPDAGHVRVWLRADGGPALPSEPVSVDASPPPPPHITISSMTCPGTFTVDVTAVDPHSGVEVTELRLDGQDWQLAEPAAVFSTGGQPGEVIVHGRARNGAGLWSDVASVVVCTLEPPERADLTRSGTFVPGTVAEPEPEPAPGPPPTSGGCGGAPGAPPILPLLALLLGRLLLHSRP